MCDALEVHTQKNKHYYISACTLRFDIILLYTSGIGCRSFAHVAMRLSFVTDGEGFNQLFKSPGIFSE